MCASYAATPSASVSTRTTVPPGTFSFAIAVTLASASPVSGVSSERWTPQPWPGPGPPLLGGGAVEGTVAVALVAGVPGAEPEPVAAAATPELPPPSPSATASSTSVRGIFLVVSITCSSRFGPSPLDDRAPRIAPARWSPVRPGCECPQSSVAAMEHGLDVVPVGVDDVRAVVDGVVLRPLAGRAGVASAGREGGCVERVDRRLVARGERDVDGPARGAAPQPQVVLAR